MITLDGCRSVFETGGNMAEEQSEQESSTTAEPARSARASRSRGARRTTARRTGTSARREASKRATRPARTVKGDVVESLNQMVNQLIKENGKLKRQLDRLAAKTTGAAGSGIERGLKSIQRRVQKALTGSTPVRRTRRTVVKKASVPRRRRTTSNSDSA